MEHPPAPQPNGLSDQARVDQINTRVKEMQREYLKWSRSAKFGYHFWNVLAVVFSAAVPVIVLIAPAIGSSATAPWVPATAGILGAAATLAKSIDSIFKNHDTWLRNNSAFGKITSERFLFEERAGVYKGLSRFRPHHPLRAAGERPDRRRVGPMDRHGKRSGGRGPKPDRSVGERAGRALRSSSARAPRRSRSRSDRSLLPMSAPERPPVLIRWIARPDACADCKRIAAGSPYERLPTWPGLGDTRCTVCRCSVEGTRAGNVMAPDPHVRDPVCKPPVAPNPSSQRSPSPRRTPTQRRARLRPSRRSRCPRILRQRRGDRSTAESQCATALRVAPLERRWTIALGLLIFIAIVAALIGR